MTATSYRPGSWLAVAGPQATVLLPAGEKQRAIALWGQIDDGAGFDDVLDALVANGLRGLSDFVLISGQTDVRVLVRGRSVVTVSIGFDTSEVTGSGSLTWSEASFSGVDSLTVTVDDSVDGSQRPLPLAGGLVRVGQLLLENAGETRSGSPRPGASAWAHLSAVEPAEAADSFDDSGGSDPAGPGVDLPSIGGAAVAAPVLALVPDAAPVPEAAPSPDDSEADEEFGLDDAYDEVADEEAEELADDLAGEDEQLEELLVEEADDDGMALADGPQALDEEIDEQVDDWSDDIETGQIPVVEDAEPLGEPPTWTPDDLPPPPPMPPTIPPPPAAPPLDLGIAESPLGPPPTWTPAPLDEEPEPVSEEPEDDYGDNPTEFIPQELSTPPTAVPTLVFSDGQQIAADHTVVVGRAPDPSRSAVPGVSAVKVPSPHQEISSTHIEIQPGEGYAAVIVTDLGSTNGTVVVQPGAGPEELRAGVPVALVLGSVIDLGDSLSITVDG